MWDALLLCFLDDSKTAVFHNEKSTQEPYTAAQPYNAVALKKENDYLLRKRDGAVKVILS